MNGLTETEVGERTKKGLINKFKDKSQKSTLAVISQHVFELPNIIVFLAIILLIVYGDLSDVLLTSGVMIMNIAISIIQELQARSSLKKINVVTKQKVTVVRSNQQLEIDPEDIVLDDLLVVKSGDYLYVDAQVLQGGPLQLDESIITGESDYQKKTFGDGLVSGSFVVSGQAYAQATKVGQKSLINKITAQARSYKSSLSPLQLNINNLVKAMTFVTMFLLVVLFSLDLVFLELPPSELIANVISIISSMIPQGIVITLTIAFTIGVIKMYRKKILVQQAKSVETLAAIKVLCMDKTGTITQNKLSVEEYVTTKGDGQNLLELTYSLIYNSSETNKTGQSILSFIEKNYKEAIDANSEIEKVDELIFNSKNKYSAVSFKSKNGDKFTVAMGAPDILLKHETSLANKEKDLSSLGRRNIAVIKISGSTKFDENVITGDLISNAEVLGFFSLEDKIRSGAKSIILEFISQGIKPVIISGDGANTLKSIVAQLNIDTINKVSTGEDILKLKGNSSELHELILTTDIFARVSPEQKKEIIQVLQRSYGRVAMIGDGINDALAIKTADLGVSMNDGANVTKNIADVILLDNDLGKLANVMKQGKEILFDMLRSAQLLVIKNVYSLLLIVGAFVFLLPFPFTFRGLFILALLNTNLPIIAIFFEKDSKNRNFDFIHELKIFTLAGGFIAGTLSLGVFIWSIGVFGLEQSRMIVLTSLIFTGITNYQIVVNKSYNLLSTFRPNKYMIVSFFNLIIYSGFIFFQPSADLFQLEKLNSTGLLISAVTFVLYTLIFSMIGKRLSKL